MIQQTNEFWWWQSGDGALKTLDQKELEAALARGAIAPKTYVWKTGWAEWLRAAQVAELQPALPQHLTTFPVRPKLNPDATHPPPIPAEKPGTMMAIDVDVDISAVDLDWGEPTPSPRRNGTNGANGMNGKSNGKSSLKPIVPVESNPHNDRPDTQVLGDAEIMFEDEPPPGQWAESARTFDRESQPPRTQRGIAPPQPPAAAAAAALVGRAAPPTAQPKSPLAQTQLMAHQPQYYPPQTPPPPYAPPAPAPIADLEPAPAPVPQQLAPQQQAGPIVPVSDPDNEAPTAIHPAALRDEPARQLPAWDVDPEGTNEHKPDWPAPMAAQPQQAQYQYPPQQQQQGYTPAAAWAPAPRKKSKLPLVLGTLFGLGFLGVIAAGAGVYFLKPELIPFEVGQTKPTAKPTAAPVAKPVETAKPAPVTSTTACTTTGSGKKVAASIVLNVPVSAVAAPGGALVAVGFADSATNATGITLDAKTLEVKEPFSRAGTTPIAGVVPLVQSGTLAFGVDHQGGELAPARTVDAKQPFTIGLTTDGFARVVHNGRPEVIWADAAGEKITDPRVASVADGHLVTFRRGSEIRVGWLALDGKKKSGLSTISAAGSRVGTPNVSAGEQGALVTFAARDDESSPWGIRLAQAKAGALPTTSSTFELPAGGPGTEAISPTATALSGGRWLLQWTEGKAGERMVRAQTLSAELKPLGEAMTLSPKGVEAGQGAVAAASSQAVATYLVKNATGYELWANSLSCP